MQALRSAVGHTRQYRVTQKQATTVALLRAHRSRTHLYKSRPQCAAADRATATTEPLSVEIPTAEARSCIRFQLLPSGNGQAIVVSAVAEGSSAEQAGVQRGMKLTGISDPIRRDDVWELQDRPSLRYVRDVLRMRSSPFITLQFETEAELLEALQASEGAVSMAAAASSNSSSVGSVANPTASSIESLSSLASVGDDSETVADRLQQQYEKSQQAGKAMTAVEERQQRRKDYMELVGQRNDSGFLLILLASFLLPALVILLVAYSTGYLDNLYNNSLSNIRSHVCLTSGTCPSPINRDTSRGSTLL